MQDRMPSTPGEASEAARAADRTERRGASRALAYATRSGDRRALLEACRRLGVHLIDVLREPQPPGDRPALAQALDRLDDGSAGCLVVRRLADLDGGPGGLDAVLERVEARGARLVALDVGLDTDQPTGRAALRSRRAPAPGGAHEASGATRGGCIGYACAAQAPGGVGADLAVHRATIERCCAEAGLELVELVGDREGRQGKPLDRPGLAHAMRRLAAGDAGCLVVARLDHLSQSVAELGHVMARLQELDARLIAIDLALDTGTQGGDAAARALTTIGRWEHERLSERTRAGLEAADAKRRAGRSRDETETVADLRRRIAGMREQGMTLQAIADVLNEEGVPTQRGGTRWRPSSVQSAAGYRRPSPRRHRP